MEEKVEITLERYETMKLRISELEDEVAEREKDISRLERDMKGLKDLFILKGLQELLDPRLIADSVVVRYKDQPETLERKVNIELTLDWGA